MGKSAPRSILSPEDQRVTFVELFFDLVFVFSVTQVVGLLHHHLDWIGVGQTILVFWLVWWGWTQFTWALNAADTTHPSVELATLAATAVAFFMAAGIPNAFSGGSLWFAIPYVLVRVIGLGLYVRVSWESSPEHRAAVKTFALLSVGGLAAVLAGGIFGGTATYWLWGLAILLDIIAALIAGEIGDWDLHPEHFAERHGLFVIIALGESLIVAAGGLAGAEVTVSLSAVATLAVGATCALWWSYFAYAKPKLDAALEEATGTARATMARDAFSLVHFGMALGVIAFAVAVEKAILHPEEALSFAGRLALALGVALFTGGMGLALWRATKKLSRLRMLIAMATATLVVSVSGLPPAVSLAIAFVGVVAIAAVEHRNHVPASTINL
jgi:low temperature requirement protein LtrA